MDIQGFGVASSERIKAFQERYDVKLPDEYIHFLRSKNGGTVSMDTAGVFVPSLNDWIYIDIFYGLDLKEDCLNIEYWMRRYGSELPAETVIVGDDQLKGFLVLICDGPARGIYYWDDKFNFPSSSDEGCVYLISNEIRDIGKLIS